MFTRVLLVCGAVFVAACSSDSSPGAPKDAASSNTMGDAGASDLDAAPEARAILCDDPHATTEMTCGELRWEASPLESRLRNHHVTAIVTTKEASFLYVFGGVNGSTLMPHVDRMKIGADGSLAAPESMKPLTRSVGGHTGGVVGNSIVLAGGTISSGVTGDAFQASIAEDGTPSAWKPAGSTGHPRMHPGSFVVGSSVYVVGGFNENDVWDDIVRATVQDDGTLSAWIPAGKLPGPRSHFSISNVENYVYVTGGLDKPAHASPPLRATTLRGEVGEDGTVQNWTPMPDLPVALATHASFVYGGYLYVGGGINDSTDSGQEHRLWRSPIQADHALGSWESVAPLPVARAHVHQLPVHGNHVYSVAGATDYELHSTAMIAIGSFQ